MFRATVGVLGGRGFQRVVLPRLVRALGFAVQLRFAHALHFALRVRLALRVASGLGLGFGRVSSLGRLLWLRRFWAGGSCNFG